MQRLKPKNRQGGKQTGCIKAICEGPAQAGEGKSPFITTESTASSGKPAREKQDLAAWWAASPQALQANVCTTGDPWGAQQPWLGSYPASATLGKDIKPCQIFCFHSQGD